MSTQTATILLASVSLVAELGGLVLVVAGIVQDRHKAQKLFGTIVQGYSPAVEYDRAGVVEALGGRQPSPEQRLKRVEARVSALEQGAEARSLEMRKLIDAELNRVRLELQEKLKQQDRELRNHLREQLVGSVQGRKIGVGLLGIGIVAGALANIVGAC